MIDDDIICILDNLNFFDLIIYSKLLDNSTIRPKASKNDAKKINNAF